MQSEEENVMYLRLRLRLWHDTQTDGRRDRQIGRQSGSTSIVVLKMGLKLALRGLGVSEGR